MTDRENPPILSADTFHAIFDYSGSGLAIVEEDGTISLANARFSRAVGWSLEEIEGKMSWRNWTPPEDIERLENYQRNRTADSPSAPEEFECSVVRRDGTLMQVLVRVGMIPHTKRSMISAMDITELRRMEEALKESESRFRGAFEASAIGMCLVGLDGRWLKVNQSLCNILGYSEEELLAKTFQDITYPDDLENDLEHLKKLIEDEIPYYQIEKRYCHRDGYITWGLLSVSVVRDSRGYPLYLVGQVEDITERKFFEERLRTALITDELTGLYNRKGFFELSWERLKVASKRKEPCTLFLVKLDDIKLLNDTLGQKQGDTAIRKVGRMLQEIFQEKGVIGRIGGVEFAVLAGGAAEAETAQLQLGVAGFKNDNARNCPISITVQVAQCAPEERLALEQLLARANEKRRKLRAGE